MTTRRGVRPAWILAAVCAASMFAGLGSTSLWEPDEPRFAAATRQMLRTGDYLTPWFNGQPRFEKPILFYWMQAPAFVVLGPTETAARLPAAVLGGATVFLLYQMGRRVFSARAGLVGALVLATSFRFVIYCRQGLTDVPVLFLEAAAIWAFWRGLEDDPRRRRFALLGWACVGLALATKGPVAVIPLLVWVPWLAATRQLRRGLERMHVLPGVLVATAIATPWYVYMIAVHGRAYVDHALGYELVRRYADAEFPGPKRGFLYYFGVWPGDAAPWTLFFIAAVAWIARRWKTFAQAERRGILLCLVWFTVVLLLFSSASGKLPHYLLPLYPPMALLVGLLVDRAAAAGEHAPRASWWIPAGLTGVLLLGAAAFVALFLGRAFAVGIIDVAMALPAVLASGAVALLALTTRRRPLAAIGSIVAALAAAFAVLGVHVAPRYLQQMQPIRDLGVAVARLARPEDRVALQGSFGQPGLVFYADRVVEWFRSRETAAEFLSGDGRRFCVMSAADLEAVRRMTPRPLHVLARRDVLSVRIKRVLEGRAADPDRALLLVANAP